VKTLLLSVLALTSVLGRADSIDDLVRQTMASANVPGASVAVIKNGRIVKIKGYGLAEIENSVAASPETVYELASLSKQFAATALMMLAEEGKVSVEDPVSKYLPNTPTSWATMKVANLLNHTSGIQELVLDPKKMSSLAFFHYKREQQLQDIEASSLLFAPGEKMSYSNSGYELVALIVEAASGEKFQDFVTNRILKPLKMTSTDFVDMFSVIPHRSNGYTVRSGHLAVWKMSQTLGSLDLNAFGGMESSVLDLAKWEIALEEGKLLKPETWKSVWTPRRLNNGSPVADYDGPYGFGWHVNDLPIGHVLEHTGHTGTAMLRLPDQKLAVIVLSNLGAGNPKPFANDHGYDVKSLGRAVLNLAAKRWD
jgi:CubicO group peptidase (beta-lactamase class C family)